MSDHDCPSGLRAQLSRTSIRERILLHACHLIHALGAGGAEEALVELARRGPSAGLRLSVVSLVDDREPLHAHALHDLGLDVRSLSLRSRWDVRAFRRAARVVDHLRPDILHTHMKHADLVGAAVARRLGLPLVSTLHVIEDAPTPLGRTKRRLAARARSRIAARVIAVSEAQRRWYLKTYPAAGEHVVTIHNGVSPPQPLDDSTRAALRRALGVPADGVLALAVAVMRAEKGHRDLLAAAASLPDDSPVTVVLVGDGKERPRLEGIAAADPRISRRVRFAGWRNDVPALMHAADLVVHPSHADALPTTLILALAAGVPAVATNVGGIPEIVADGAGVLIPPRDPTQLARALADLAAAPAARRTMGATAKRRFAESFDAGVWMRELVTLYRRVLEERNHG